MAVVEIAKRNKFMGHEKRQGFSLVELMFAMFVLTVGVLGGMTMILMGMTRNNTNRVDTTATNAAQTVMEAIAGAPANSTGTLSGITDCLGNTMTINTSPGTGTAGAPLQANNVDIDFSAAAVTGYQMTYTVCNNAANKNGLQTTYDVRWRITALGGTLGKLVTVSARQPFIGRQTGIGFITPVTLRTIVGM
jgi:prepilin-type N-terminal cleavage/methylation domain-containing protein